MSASKNKPKTAEELALEFIRAEKERQYNEPLAILARLAGAN